MNEEEIERIEQLLNARLQPMDEAHIEISARLSAQRFLLEVLYANAFATDPQSLEKLMSELMRLTRVASTRAGPMPDDSAIDLQARIAVQLERFGASVAGRIASGRTF